MWLETLIHHDKATVTRVLLADGWHTVVLSPTSTFVLELGMFRFRGLENGSEWLHGPISSVIAVSTASA